VDIGRRFDQTLGEVLREKVRVVNRRRRFEFEGIMEESLREFWEKF